MLNGPLNIKPSAWEVPRVSARSSLLRLLLSCYTKLPTTFFILEFAKLYKFYLQFCVGKHEPNEEDLSLNKKQFTEK